MSELKAPDGLRDFSLHEEPVEEFPLEGLSEEKLLELHSKVESRLGGLALTEVNLVKETLLQIKRAKVLQELATSEKGTPMNQRAQVQNSLAGLLTQLSKIQIELYSSERIKRIQNAVIRVVKTLPDPQQVAFFDMLEIELAAEAKETDEEAASAVD
jgi:hypothetical protein